MLQSPGELAEGIATRAKQKRLRLNITQRELAERSGVSFGSVKRFEQKGEVSLKHLLQIAIVLRASTDFELLFKEEPYKSVDEVVREKKSQERKRARGNDS
jgi:transcriptional regulator with XRE-family HTH domain